MRTLLKWVAVPRLNLIDAVGVSVTVNLIYAGHTIEAALVVLVGVGVSVAAEYMLNQQ